MALHQRRMMSLCALEGKVGPCRRYLLFLHQTPDNVPDKNLSIPLMTRIQLENLEAPFQLQYHKDSALSQEILVS